MNGARVTEIKTNHIILNNSQKINFRYLVGADGSNSITRKFLGLAKEKRSLGYNTSFLQTNIKTWRSISAQRFFIHGMPGFFPTTVLFQSGQAEAQTISP